MQSKKRTRTSHSKVRTGCHTCKARRVKCDEQQPSCQKCISTGRKCEGYKTHHEWVVVVAPPRRPVTDGFEDDRSRRHFDYFRTHAVHKLSRFFDPDHWGKLVLQEAHTSPAVRHAVVALSCSHRDSRGAAKPNAQKSNEAYAAQQYSNAIKLLIKETADNTRESRMRTLMCGILFISIETLRGNTPAAIHHLDGCLKIVKEVREQLGMVSLEQDHLETTAYLLRELIPMFTRLNRDASICLGQGLQSVIPDSVQNPDVDSVVGLGFGSVLEALECLFWLGDRVHNIMGWNLLHINQADLSESYMERYNLYEGLMRWESSVQQLASSLANTNELDKLSILQIHHRTLLTLLGSSFHFTETYLDTYYWAFEDILNFVEKLFNEQNARKQEDASPIDDWETRSTTNSFSGTLSTPSTPSRSSHSPAPSTALMPTSQPRGKTPPTTHPIFVLDCGTLFSLYWTALKCRDSSLRRRAISLLEFTAGKDMAMHAAVAKRVVEIEEGRAYEDEYVDFQGAENVPEGRRVHNVNVDVMNGERMTKVAMRSRRDGMEDGEWCEIVEYVSW
ncbi:hypothetical protein DM02DRAFT_3510 [Periconia macrospinosa]|uniref:Zn(2)-C6 fungal-type domain-containing protein n=1 Tax=Periconia macrospinosa TaxID=97972 RepID=A0A2V1EGL6_9PLEO|nr:hypothetical protein DM02DRAFT_3510 [Periconia macrospinosa]